MSIYAGDPIEEQYAFGRSRGYERGKYNFDQGLGLVSDGLVVARDNVSSAQHRVDRAYFLGYLRGYREAVRTKLNERWGT